MLSSRVRRLRLKVLAPSQMPRARRLLEEGLRQTSLDSSQRLFIVRKLRLANLPAGTAPGTVSFLIETDGRRLQRLAVPGTEHAAAEAAVVVFENPVSACVALALRLSSGDSPSAWFWPLAVPGYRYGMDQDAALRATLFSVLEHGAPVLGAATMMAALCEHGCLKPLVRSLRGVSALDLWRRCGWTAGPRGAMRFATEESASSMQISSGASPFPAALREALDDPGTDDDLKLWLAGVRLIAGAPHRALQPDPIAHARRWIAELRNRDQKEEDGDALPESMERADLRQQLGPGDANADNSAGPTTGTRVTAGLVENSGAQCRAEDASSSSAARAGHAGIDEHSNHRNDAARTAHWFDRERISANAGLLFLINAASHLGIDEWLAANPGWAQWGLVPRLFESLAHRLDISAADPIMRAVPAHDRLLAAPSSFVLPASWRVLAGASASDQRKAAVGGARLITVLNGRLPLAGCRDDAGADAAAFSQFAEVPEVSRCYPGGFESALIDAWLNAMRLWCRRYSRHGLRSLVRRAGEVTCSPTHVDVSFELDVADIRVRRSGLDIDPGWVSWFGRVVKFHYGVANRGN